jgi:hypothetical protein
MAHGGNMKGGLFSSMGLRGIERRQLSDEPRRNIKPLVVLDSCFLRKDHTVRRQVRGPKLHNARILSLRPRKNPSSLFLQEQRCFCKDRFQPAPGNQDGTTVASWRDSGALPITVTCLADQSNLLLLTCQGRIMTSTVCRASCDTPPTSSHVLGAIAC